MKKTICLIVLLSVLLVGSSLQYKNSFDNNIKDKAVKHFEIADLKNLSYENVTYLSIKGLKGSASNGWVLKQKIVAKKEDIEKIISFLKSMSLKETSQDTIYCFGEIVELKTPDEVTFVFLGDRVNVNGKYFGIKVEDDEALMKIYESLSYKEDLAKF